MAKINGKWIPDPENLRCLHDGSKIEVIFKKQGNTFIGKLNDMPDDLMDAWAAEPNGDRHIRQAVTEAEAVFLQARAGLLTAT